jgi:putative acetyltransferase
MHIRPYRSEDAQALSALFFDAVRTLGAKAYSPAQVEAWAPAAPDPAEFAARCGDGRMVLVAEAGQGRVAGFIDLEADGHIDRLFRSPEPWAVGAGAALLDAILDHAADQGLDRLYVEASELARPLFERRGFRLVARREFERNGVMIHNYAMAMEGF